MRQRTSIAVGFSLVLGGCSLYDAWYGEVEEPQCVWRDCACAIDDPPCDPREACTPTSCRRCLSDDECDGDETCNLDREVCSSCEEQTVTEAVARCFPADECFLCENDESDPNQYCVRDSCFY